MPKNVQLKEHRESDDPEELQFKDETNHKWVAEWKKAIKQKK